MTPSRRSFIQWTGLVGLAGAAPAAQALRTNIHEAAALQGWLERYASFGNKASGGPGDLASGVWLEEILSDLGYRCRRQFFDVPFFDLEQAELSCGGARAAVIPQAIVTPTAPGGLTAPLRLASTGSPGEAAGHEDLTGAIALVALPYKRWVTLGDPQIAGPLTQTLGRGAAAVVLVTTGPSGEAIALNAPVSGAFQRPVAVLAPKDAEAFLGAAAQGAPGTLRVTGKGGGLERRRAFNVIARLERGAPSTVVLSTPRSGWLGCAAERGSGLVVWLSLARWLAMTVKNVDVELLSTSGHEYSFLGGEQYLKEEAPKPQVTRLWVHIGACAAARDWHELSGKLLPLPSADAQRVLTATGDLLKPVREAFQGISGLEAAYLADEAMAGGELINVLGAGYRSAIGLYGIHRYFHTRADDLRCVSGSLAAPLAHAFRAAISAALV